MSWAAGTKSGRFRKYLTGLALWASEVFRTSEASQVRVIRREGGIDGYENVRGALET